MALQKLIRLSYNTAAAVLVVLALLGIVLAAGTVLHAHVSDTPGLFNQEHDLSYLAALGGAVLSPDVTTATTLDLVGGPLQRLAAHRPAAAPQRHADPRAPPRS